MKKITQRELKNVIDRSEEALVLDVRTLREYLDFRIENIPFIPLELLDHIQHPEAKWSKSEPVYVISYTEARSKAFCHKLETLGYRTFYVEEGGVEAWCRQYLSILSIVDHENTDKLALMATSGAESGCFVFNFKIFVKKLPGWANFLPMVISQAWFFEKMNCNVMFLFNESYNYFENSTLKVAQKFSFENCIALRFGKEKFPNHSLWISSEYAYSVISRLTIKKEIQDEADQWARINLKGDWIGVHYRGTDRTTPKQVENHVKMDTYISYLKKVVDKHRSIFVCSDQAQFIDQINDAFPGKVFSRDIQRSYDEQSLHRGDFYKGPQQRIDALIDLLVLSKTDIIYKTGGEFPHLTRFFNPTIKIISLVGHDNQHYRYLPENFVHVPQDHLLVKRNF